MDVVARRVVDGNRMAHLPILHSAARVLTTRNLLVRKCAHMVHAALLAGGGSIQTAARGRLAKIFQIECWEFGHRSRHVVRGIPPRNFPGGGAAVEIGKRRAINCSQIPPEMPANVVPKSTFPSYAEEFRGGRDMGGFLY